MSKASEVDDIINLISTWILIIRLRDALSYTDVNKIAEGFCAKLLNLVYGYQLKDLNKERPNFAALDLGDDSSSAVSLDLCKANRFLSGSYFTAGSKSI